MTSTNDRNTATFIHLSTLSQYIIPFGNYIIPIIIWSSKKNESQFIDVNGKNAINFQLSMFLYTMITLVVAIPVFIYSIFNNTTIAEPNWQRADSPRTARKSPGPSGRRRCLVSVRENRIKCKTMLSFLGTPS